MLAGRPFWGHFYDPRPHPMSELALQLAIGIILSLSLFGTR